MFQFAPNQQAMFQQGQDKNGPYAQQSTPGGFTGHTLVSARNPMQELLLGSGVYADRMKREDALKSLQGTLGMFGLGGGSASGSGSRGGGQAGGYKELSDSLLGQVDKTGGSQRERINSAYDTSLDGSLSRLYDRGFANSSLSTNTEQTSNKQRQSSLTELEDSLLGQKIGIGQNVGLAGLNAQNQRDMAASQFQYQMLGGLFGGLFG